MAGSIVPNRKPRNIGGVRNKEVLVILTCVSDSEAGGTIPDIILENLGEYALDEVQPIPDPGSDGYRASSVPR